LNSFGSGLTDCFVDFEGEWDIGGAVEADGEGAGVFNGLGGPLSYIREPVGVILLEELE